MASNTAIRTKSITRTNDSLDNRRSNLRVTLDQNQTECRAAERQHIRLQGVSWDKGQEWNAQIAVNRKQIHLGLFTTPEAARDARDVAALDLHGEFASDPSDVSRLMRLHLYAG